MNQSNPSLEPATNMTKYCLIGALLAIIGIGISVYATSHHLELKASGSTDYGCNINDTFSCDEVARSQFSEVFGIPMGVYGIGFFAALLLLFGMAQYLPKNREESLQTLAALSVIGLLTSLVLGGISIFSIGAMCLSCIGVYSVCLLLAINLFVFKDGFPRPFSIAKMFNGGIVAIFAVTVCIVGFRYLNAGTPKPDTEVASNDSHNAGLNLLPKVNDIKVDNNAYSGMGEDFRKGSDEAKVRIVEFADFQCPACSNAAKTVKRIGSTYGPSVSIVFKNYPLDQACNPAIKRKMHEFACQGAKLARCLGEKGNFWKMHDQLFANQQEFSTKNLNKWAKKLGLSDSEIKSCLASKDVEDKIRADVKQGNELGVDSTPTLFINGQKFIGNPNFENVAQEIDKLL